MNYPTQFAIFGSSDSTDLDVMYFMDEMPSLQECKELASELEMKHQSDKSVDVNFCVINDGTVTSVYKGTVDEVNNMLYYTTRLHSQPSTFPEVKCVKRNIPLKVARALRGMLSYLSRTQYRPLIKQALKGDAWLKIQMLEVIDLVHITDLGDKNKTLRDYYKLCAFQMGQALGLMHGLELYSKSDISKHYPTLRPYLYKELDTFAELDEIKKEFIFNIRTLCNLNEIHE